MEKKQGFKIFILTFLTLLGFSFLGFLYWGEIYKAESRLIINQSFSAETDPYLMAQENQYLAGVLAEMTRTEFFYEMVSSKEDFPRDYFEKGAKERKDQILKKWRKRAVVQPQGDSGIIKISFLGNKKEEASKIVELVRDEIIASHQNFHLRGEEVEVKVIDPLLVKKVFPDWKLQLALAFVGGLLVWGMVYFFKKEN